MIPEIPRKLKKVKPFPKEGLRENEAFNDFISIVGSFSRCTVNDEPLVDESTIYFIERNLKQFDTIEEVRDFADKLFDLANGIYFGKINSKLDANTLLLMNEFIISAIGEEHQNILLSEPTVDSPT